MKPLPAHKAGTQNKTKMQTRKYENRTNEELQIEYANCLATRMGALGHGKAHYNGLRVIAIREEMTLRGIKPDGRKGTFNGEGSY